MRITGHKDVKSLNRYYQPDLSDIARHHDPAAKAMQVAAERLRNQNGNRT